MDNHYTHFDFFQSLEPQPAFDSALHDCMTHNHSLHMSLTSSGVSIASTPEQTKQSKITLKGTWRIPPHNTQHQSTGARQLAPFFFLIEEYTLPADKIFTVGKGHRSTADFFMRNLFYSTSRSENISYITTHQSKSDSVIQGSQKLAKFYLWITQAMIKDPVFEHPDILNLLCINTHLPVLNFSNNALKTGADEYRLSFKLVTPEQEQKDHALKMRKELSTLICS